MSRPPEPLFYEEQSFRQTRLRILTAIPPAALTLAAIWQAGLGHPWGKQPMSNTSLIFWSIFLWLVYLRLVFVKLVTEVYPGELRVRLRGLFRSSRVALDGIESATVVTLDPVRDWGGYGFRRTNKGTAFLAGGREGVELRTKNGGLVLIGSQRAAALLKAIQGA
ncbi:MAG TPA: hypothetical protein VKT81_07125 [Bryobacteraceae bacterium]|nr:hypothetical protein [Bryobacteraceae bacterium]